MSRAFRVFTALAVTLLAFASVAQAQISYIYDELGRLKAVVDPANDTAIYTYDAVGNLLSIARQSSSTPVIVALTTSAAMVGATVTIEGTGFSTTPSQNTVTFNGTAATVTSASATKLVVTVPTGATTGSIVVTAPGGNATSPGTFTVLTSSGAPTIISFSPVVGFAGDSTTITGTNYETTAANNKPAFNPSYPIYGRVTAATSTSLSVTVPPAATSGRVSVATPAGKVTSSQDFFIPPAGYTAASVVFTGRLTLDGSSVTVSIPTASKIGMVVFDATAGQRVSLGVSSVTVSHQFFIYGPTGTLITTWSGYDFDPVPLTGTYTAVVVPNGSATGSVTLTLSSEVTGSITIDGSAVSPSIARVGQRARITFAGTAGQRLDLGLTSSTIGGATVTVLKPDGSALGSSINISTGDYALDTLPALPSTGTYTILIDPSSSNTGSVTLTLSQEVVSTITVDGAAVSISITRAGQQARVSFSGTAGQRLSLGMTSHTISGGCITFVNPDGSTLASTCFGAGNLAADTPVLPTTGTYDIVIDPASAYTGNATLTLSTEVTGTLTIGGGATTITISRAGQRARYTFSGTAGNRISATLNSSTIAGAAATFLNPNGSTLASDGFGTGNKFFEPATTATTGTYTLVIDPSAAHTGSVTVTLYNVPADVTGSLTVNGSAQTITLSGPGQKATLTFTWNSGQQVTVHGANSTMGCVNLILQRPDGWAPSSSPCTATYSLSATSSTSGTFTIKLDPVGTNTGSVDLSVTNP
jgi:YD repeat-containing protein